MSSNIINLFCYADKTRGTMSMALALFALVSFADAISRTVQCPEGCDCNAASSNSQLSIDCDHGSSDVDVDQLSRQLDSLLSADLLPDSLTSLSITNTPLTRVPASVCQLLNLTTLRLDGNRITELPDNCFTKLTQLVTLSLTHNSIGGLQDGLFDGLQSLVTLDLSSNRISYIGLRVFSNASDLTSLRSLELSFNELTSLEPWWYYRCIQGSAASPVGVSLYRKRIANFTNKLQFNFRCSMKSPFGYLDLRLNQIAHIMDMLQGWNIADIAKLTCLKNFRQSGHPLMKIHMTGVNYHCDCIDFPIYKWVNMAPRTGFLNRVYCTGEHFQAGFGQPVLANTIPLIEFVCEISDRCPPSCRCVYRPANSTLHVYCSRSNISSLPLDLPPLPKTYVKYKLDFSNNKLLHRLQRRPYFVNTSILDVSNITVV